jgi:hypothetical protein
LFYIKGSKHLYLIDYNFDCNLPVWSNLKEYAVCSKDLKELFKIQDFIKENHHIESQISWEGIDYE